MIKVIYKELPINQISYMTREEFSPTGPEKNFYQDLKNSMSKHGLKDPVHIEYGGEDYGDILKVLVGNNRMVIAKKLGFKLIPSIVKLLHPDDNNIEGTPINNEQEISDLFHTKKELDIRKKDGIIWEVMPKNNWRNGF